MDRLYIETQLETQILETQLENQREKQRYFESSSSSDLGSDQEAGKTNADDDDDDFNFLVKLLCDEFQIRESETLRDHVQDWLGDHVASHVEAAIRKAVGYSPKSPIVYIQGILDDEVGRQRGSGSRRRDEGEDYLARLPADLQDIVNF